MNFNMAGQVDKKKKPISNLMEKKKTPIAASNFYFSRAAEGTVKELLLLESS